MSKRHVCQCCKYQSVIGNCRSLENIGQQKKLGNYKNYKLFTHKKRYFKTAKPERSFSSNFIIQLHLNSSYSFYMEPYVTTHYETSELI